MTIYGGDVGGTGLGDVWVLSHANGSGGTAVWSKFSPTGTAPSLRTGQTATYDSVSNRMTIFGGVSNGLTLSDTWILTSANGMGAVPSWIPIKAQTAPSVAYHSAVYDPALNDMYVFAGSSSADKLSTNSHAFTLFGANGETLTGNRWILGGPAVRYSQSAFYELGDQRIIRIRRPALQDESGLQRLLGSFQRRGFVQLKWTVLYGSGTLPSPRFGHTGLYDSGSDRMMIFGGATGYPAPCVNDYHILQHANTKGGALSWLTSRRQGLCRRSARCTLRSTIR